MRSLAHRSTWAFHGALNMKYIVVGETSGIGLAAAKMAVDAGHEVIAVGRDPRKFSAAQSIGAATAQVDAANLA
jgi:NAD(P)-dependent dehydrogenase (short-subunit alcohol dehydrogenase family)